MTRECGPSAKHSHTRPSLNRAASLTHTLCIDLLKALERTRWNTEADIPCGQFDAGKLAAEQALAIKMNAITEWAALPASERLLRDLVQDSDFSALLSIGFYEEQKHALGLMEDLRRFKPEFMPTRKNCTPSAFRSTQHRGWRC